MNTFEERKCAPPFVIIIVPGPSLWWYKHTDDNLYKSNMAFRGRGLGGINDSRVSQEEQVEHRVVLAEVDQRPAEHPATHGQQAEPSCDQNHVAEERSAAALRHLVETDDRITSYQKDQHCPLWGLTHRHYVN